MKHSLSTFLTITTLSVFTAACTDTMTDHSLNNEAALALPANQVESFKLTQPWFEKTQPNFRQGIVELHWTAHALVIDANLSDDIVYTASDADNQHMWELGDVFEIFLQIEGQEDYVELHITPANTRFHAHKPNVPGNDPATGEWKPIENWLVTPIGFEAKAQNIKGGWHAAMQIPPSVLGLDTFTPGTEIRIAFARYDGAPAAEPMLSASAPHAPSDTVSFHIPEDWHRIELN